VQHHTDYKLGVAMIDRFTYATLEYFEHNKVAEDSKNSLKELVRGANLMRDAHQPDLQLTVGGLRCVYTVLR
jgi:glycosylphosphatidylinositol transamidase (GPIT) subunit GPI8